MLSRKLSSRRNCRCDVGAAKSDVNSERRDLETRGGRNAAVPHPRRAAATLRQSVPDARDPAAERPPDLRLRRRVCSSRLLRRHPARYHKTHHKTRH